jgi:hypothetical protein
MWLALIVYLVGAGIVSLLIFDVRTPEAGFHPLTNEQRKLVAGIALTWPVWLVLVVVGSIYFKIKGTD